MLRLAPQHTTAVLSASTRTLVSPSAWGISSSCVFFFAFTSTWRRGSTLGMAASDYTDDAPLFAELYTLPTHYTNQTLDWELFGAVGLSGGRVSEDRRWGIYVHFVSQLKLLNTGHWRKRVESIDTARETKHKRQRGQWHNYEDDVGCMQEQRKEPAAEESGVGRSISRHPQREKLCKLEVKKRFFPLCFFSHK